MIGNSEDQEDPEDVNDDHHNDAQSDAHEHRSEQFRSAFGELTNSPGLQVADARMATPKTGPRKSVLQRRANAAAAKATSAFQAPIGRTGTSFVGYGVQSMQQHD